MTQRFASLEDIRAALTDLPEPDEEARLAAESRNAHLTKPPGALGRLEELAVWYASWRGDPRPRVARPQIVVFAGNHGVAAQGVSAFPPDVTAQMVSNFHSGGAAINQLAKAFGARLDVHAVELDRPTLDFTQEPAMDERDLAAAMSVGWDAVDREADLLVAGEMGIGNTTSAAAVAAALFGGDPEDWVGPGTGVAGRALRSKIAVVAKAVDLHAPYAADPLEVLRRLGGRELAAMAGAILAARHARIPVILDGFICCAAAAALEHATQGALDHAVAGHASAETAHMAVLERLGKEPLLSLGLRLGEGSGAALALSILQGALACHSGMATFAEAGVSDG